MAYGQQDLNYPVKFIKGLATPVARPLSSQQAGRFFFKLLYEFWGFCVNGTDSLYDAGGFASTNGLTVPSGFLSASVRAVGTDGNTDFGTATFSSNQVSFSTLNVTGSLRGMYLVMWKPGDNSPDDSVYRITGLDDDGRLRLDVRTGGTTRKGGKASFSARSAIRFRVVDIAATSTMTSWTTPLMLSQSMIMNFEAAPNVNVNQRVPQVKLDLTGSQSQVRMFVSPSGSWTGTTFTDSSPELLQTWFSAGNSGKGLFYFFAGKEFMITNLKGEDGAWNSANFAPGFHFEIPKRLYSSSVDPNPVTWAMWQAAGATGGTSPTTGSYANGFKMFCQDGIVRDWMTVVRDPHPMGTRTNYHLTASGSGLWYGINSPAKYLHGWSHFNKFNGQFLSTDAVLSQTGSVANPTQFSYARVKLRRVRFTARNTKPYLRLGPTWLHVGGGMMWPWDGSEVPFGLFWEGGGAIPGDIAGEVIG